MGEKEKILIFALSDLRCALPLSIVERILRAVEISYVPMAPDIIMGLVNVQGRVIPVLNLRRKFRLPEIEVGLDDQLIIASTAERPVAVLVNSVFGVAEYRGEDVVAPEEIYPGIEYLEGVAKLADGIIFIYNLEHFFSPEVADRIPPDLMSPGG